MPEPKAIEPAPGLLDHVRQFVNTLDLEEGRDDLRTPENLRSWLGERGLLDSDAVVTLYDLERGRMLRESLRDLLLANNRSRVDQVAVAHLNEVGDLAELRLRFLPDGTARLRPLGGGVNAALGELLAIAYSAMGDGSWSRLKACPESRCRWAFYDSSKNRSRRWCTMTECGNRAKGRRYRARHREPANADDAAAAEVAAPA
jgi:predicted RNA-binding Zn ribbon-like protein